MKKFSVTNFPQNRNFILLQGRQFSILVLILLIGLILPLISSAAGLVPCGRTDPGATAKERKPCQFCHLFVLFKNIVNFLLIPDKDLNNNVPLVPVIALLMIVIAGAMYILAYVETIGNPEWIKQAKSLLWSVVIGLIIIYGAWVIVNLFFEIIGISETKDWTDLKTWWKIKGCP